MKIANRLKIGILFFLIMGSWCLAACGSRTQNAFVQAVFPQTNKPISAYGWVGVTFTQPMAKDTVESAFSIIPAVQGWTFWDENTFWFRPMQALEQDIAYQAHLAGELQTADGKTFTIDHTWDVTIRDPELGYLAQGEVWRVHPDGTNPQQLSQTGGRVIEFSPDRTGSMIVFAVANDVGGQDLWVMTREGDEAQTLVNCQQDVCAEPTWSMDLAWIAYARQAFDQESGIHKPSQIWTADVKTGETAPLYQSDMAFGHSPSFSPNGEKLASYDTNHSVIRFLDIQTSQESVLPRVLPGTGEWSLDGTKMMFTDVVPAENEPFVEVYILNLDSQTVNIAFGKEMTDTDFSQPSWSPDGEWVAVSLRPVNSNANKALWIIRLKDNHAVNISNDLSATFSAYSWGPWGNRLVYQRFDLNRSDRPNSIWMWEWESQQTTLISEQGARPVWLP